MTLALPNADATTEAADIASIDTQDEIPYSPAQDKEVYCVNVGPMGTVAQGKGNEMKKIDLEAHFATKEWIDALLQNKGYPRLVEDKAAQTRRMYFTSEAFEPFTDVLLGNLLDVGEKRLKAMDAAGVDLQVLTLTAPGVESLDPQLGEPLAKSANNALAEIIRKYPERFSGYAALAPKRPEQAARELERAVKEINRKGLKRGEESLMA